VEEIVHGHAKPSWIMKLRKNIAVSETGFLFNPTTGESYSVNPIGKEILDMLAGGAERKDIRKRILEHYAIDEDSFDKDYYDFSQMLQQFHLLERTPAETTTKRESYEGAGSTPEE
jgi:hypothetical protein